MGSIVKPNDFDLPKQTYEYVAPHKDADGIASAVLFAACRDVERLIWLLEFGEYDKRIQLYLDQVPQNTEYEGLVIDHHKAHVDRGEKNFNYTVVYDEVPTTYIVYRLVHDDLIGNGGKLYKQHGWKLAVGLIGDGQKHLVPDFIWRDFPQLHAQHMSLWEDWSAGGDWKHFRYPVYGMLASGINALARQNSEQEAYEILRDARTPIEMVNHDAIYRAKAVQKKEIKRVMKENKPIDFPKVILWRFKSDIGIASYLATRLSMVANKTVITWNTATGKLSCRGDYTEMVAQQLNGSLETKNFELAGHVGYRGGNIGKVTLDELYEELALIR
jgi:hypothetical protein